MVSNKILIDKILIETSNVGSIKILNQILELCYHNTFSTTTKHISECGLEGKDYIYWKKFVIKGSPYPECYSYLLDKVTDINKKNQMLRLTFKNDEDTAVIIATRYGYLESVKYLLNQDDSDLNAANILYFAIKYDHIDIVKYIIEYKYPYNNSRGFYHIILTALTINRNNIAKYLLNNHKLDPGDLINLMKIVVMDGNIDIVEYLYDKGANFNQEIYVSGRPTTFLELAKNLSIDQHYKHINYNPVIRFLETKKIKKS